MNFIVYQYIVKHQSCLGWFWSWKKFWNTYKSKKPRLFRAGSLTEQKQKQVFIRALVFFSDCQLKLQHHTVEYYPY